MTLRQPPERLVSDGIRKPIASDGFTVGDQALGLLLGDASSHGREE